MKVGDQAFKNICQTRIITLRIDAHSIFGDIVDCQIFHRRYVHLGGVHFDTIKLEYFQLCSLKYSKYCHPPGLKRMWLGDFRVQFRVQHVMALS